MIYDVKDMKFTRSERFTLDIESFALAQGERVAIVGPNGSGKTTLLRLLAFLETPSRCTHFRFLDDEVGTRRRQGALRRRGLGFLKQHPHLFSGSVRQNLAYPLTLRRCRGAELRRRVDAMLELVDLVGHAETSVRRLSGGEQKRLALGRVLIGAPDVLLLDEPAVHLDLRSQRVIERVLLASNVSLVLATHDLHLAHRVAGRVLHLKAGRLASGLPENILEGRRSGHELVTVGGLAIHLPGEAGGEAGADAAEPGDPGAGHVGPVDAPAMVMIDPRNLVLSLEPLVSSMRNHYRGQVCALHVQGDNVWVEIDCGERLTAIITRESYEALGLNLNRDVVVSFKSHSVEVL
jgi:tungstate transport system ATP-binding protein